MKRINSQRGITLIALIITIIVLLILAVVAIRAVQGDGIIRNAQKASSDYEKAQEEEKEKLLEYEYKVEKSKGTTTKTQGEYVTEKLLESLTGQEVKIGDYVDYEAGVEGYSDENGWRVLGVENGQILLISATRVINEYSLSGREGYKNGPSQLNTVCTAYGKGEHATGARSITIEDIDKLTGYDPETAKWWNGTRKITEYGCDVIYNFTTDGYVTAEGNGEYYTSADRETGDKTFNTFHYFDEETETWKELSKGKSIIIKGSSYGYGRTEVGLKVTSQVYKMFFESNMNYPFWLASRSIVNGRYGFNYAIRLAAYGKMSGHTLGDSAGAQSTTSISSNNKTIGVRAVIYLNSNTQLELVSTASSGISTWTIK